jgi:hypothetical protein
VALGNLSKATATLALAVGNLSVASGTNSVALSDFADAYGDAQTVVASHGSGIQASIVVGKAFTTDATPRTMDNGIAENLIRFVNDAGAPVWNKTIIVRARVVARDSTPGTDSAWSFQGVVRGNGTSAYTWIGGSAPSKTLIAQDAGASAWDAVMSIGTDPVTTTAATIVMTVTGETSTNISWECTLELDEVAG